MLNNERKVVVTGMGIISPIGLSVSEMWESLIKGKSGVGYISSFDTTTFETKCAAEVKGFDACAYVNPNQAHRMDRFTQFAVAAGLQAVESARLTIDEHNADDIGVIIGNSVCGLLSISEQFKVLADNGPRKVSPILAPTMCGDAPSVQVSLILGTRGVNYSPSSACSSGTDAIGQAAELIRQGKAKAIIAGGTEAPIVPLVTAAFQSIRALSTIKDNPAAACRPFDGKRDGFVLGEGAALLVLEDAEYAIDRGAPILAELIGYGATSDAFHLTQPSPTGKSAAKAAMLALENAGISPDEVDYINAHGTATLLNDRTETNVIKAVFGDRAGNIPISATKSMTGHLLGAGGSVEAVISVMTINNHMVPPTINLSNPDPACDLDYVPNEARAVNVKTVLSNSFGFGGHNSALVFSQFN